MKDKDDSIIDLRGTGSGHSEEEADGLQEVQSGDEEFQINKVGDEDVLEAVADVDARDESMESSFEAVSAGGGGASDRVKVKFDKFITLVATHTYENILRKNADEDVIISTNLLTDLANAHEEPKGDKKIVVIFAVGISIGIVLTWLILRT